MFSLTLAPFGAKSISPGGAPIAPPAHDVLLTRALARVLVAEGGLGSGGVALAGFVEAAVEGVVRYGIEGVAAVLGDVAPRHGQEVGAAVKFVEHLLGFLAPRGIPYWQGVYFWD